MRPKIGAVSYLNTKPLVEGLQESAKEFEVIFDLPSRLADRLSDNELDVALIPVIEAVANPDYTIVSDACIACDGPVWSVKLMSKVDGPEIRSLALDEGSRTSCALTKVLLANKFGVDPDFIPLPINQDWRTVETDAVLIIGDRAMNAESPAFPFCWDLGKAWKELTGKPFVFAVWAARKGAEMDRLESVLSAARDLGLEQLSKIAESNAAAYELSRDECMKYLSHYLNFCLGSEEKSGLDLFFNYSSELGLIPAPPNSKHQLVASSSTTNSTQSRLRFYDCQTNS